MSLKKGKKSYNLVNVYLIQFLFFLFILLPFIIGSFSFLELFLVIILEALSALLLIYKKPKKYSYLLWAGQIFLILYIIIIFHFNTTFQVKEPSNILIGSFLLFTILVNIIVYLFLIFQERIVKSLLQMFASMTAVIVIIIIGFIVLEGLPAFQENDPIDFLTGTHFNAFYSNTRTHKTELVTIIEPYNLSFKPNQERQVFIQANKNDSITLNITNQGGLPFNGTIKAFSETAEIYINKSDFSINPTETSSFLLTVKTQNLGYHIIKITVSETNNNTTFYHNITCRAVDNFFRLNPTEYNTFAKQYAQNIKATFNIENKGLKNDTITFKINPADEFRPYVENEPTWDFSSSSIVFDLAPGENKSLIVQANFIQLIPGTHSFTIDVISKNAPDISETAIFTVIYQEQTTVVVDEPVQKISANKSAIYEINLEQGSTDKLGIEINKITPEWDFKLYYLNESIIINEIDEIKNIEFNETSMSLKVYMEVIPVNQQNGSICNIELIVYDWGTKPDIGILTFIIGTILTTLIAVLIAAPLGIGCAILLGEYLPEKIRRILRPIYELLAGIPSVIYGLWGFMTLGPFLKQNIYPLITGTIGKHISIFSETSYIGSDIFTASFVLSIMIVPIVITLSEDAIRSVRRELKEGSLAVGATKWQTLTHVVLPQAKSGITSSIILGTGRAIGETMAVLMIMGLTVRIPTSIFDSTSTMTGVIANTFGWAFDDPLTRHALFAIAMVLFFMVFCLNVIIFRIQRPKNLDKSKSQKNNIRSFFNNLKTKLNILKNKKRKQNKDSFIILETIRCDSNIKNKTQIDGNISLFKSNLKPMKYYFLKEKIGLIFIIFCAIFVSIFLFYILGDVIIKGAPAMRLEYFTEAERMAGLEGGFLNAIIGSLYLVGVALLVAAPLSIGAAIYINEYGKKSNIFTRIILFASDTLASTPSIVFGAFGFMFFVLTMGFRWSLLAGGLTLGIMIIPLMLRSSLESVKTVSDELREGSFALSATKWQTIVHIVIPTAIVGIISGVILSIGRAIGETAAVLLTAGYAFEIPSSPLHQVASLPNMVYNYFEFSAKNPFLMDKVYAVAFVLIIIVLILNTIARIIGYRYSRMTKN